MSASIESRVRSVLESTLGLSPEEAKGPLAMGSVAAWDSLGHMTLIAALEKRFHVRFPTFVLTEITSIDAICRELTASGVK